MPTFHTFLRQHLNADVLPTDDVLASFLPLAREVVETHAAELVAPLEGLADLQVEGLRIWFEEARRLPQRQSPAELHRVEAAARATVEVVAETRLTTNVTEDSSRNARADIGRRDEPIARAVFLRGYVAWEHQLGHHDPLTDVFSLGLILASLACGLDLTDPDELERFVIHRRNPFALNPNLHPVLARAILRMTELDRHRRLQDLAAVVHSLERYRDQEVELEFDLTQSPGFHTRDLRSRQQMVLAKLRERLFDISRRNSLLQFRATQSSVNLTHASVPLSCDIRNIPLDRILVCDESLRKSLASGKNVSLNKYLNFAEALYLPSVLERIIGDSRRDQAEFGFSQLRLVLCFISWTNLKSKPIERFDSPLILLPVRLVKSKGIRDTYSIEPLSTEVDVNPVVRHLFEQLYDIRLPETIDLAETDLRPFFDFLRAKVQASEPAVTVNTLDRPRIELLHEKARRRLDQYRRQARIAGRGVRSFLDLDYSYDPANYHPLGIKLFNALVRSPGTRLREVIEERPRPRSYVAPEPDAPVVEVEKSFYRLQDAAEENPYIWNLDLCGVTLAHFRYRKMSLVRDYEALLRDSPSNAAFEATFSLTPRPAGRPLPEMLPLDQRRDVVLCDPTQSLAVAEARRGESYIIQGPPGTGKSQTITNLIADYVARGLRVLFVCEKRAAIDVVYARLRQCGLSPLCALIHDSQTDKKEFIADLRQTYEMFLAESDAKAAPPEERRSSLLFEIDQQLRPLAEFDTAMRSTPSAVGVPVRMLLERCSTLHDKLPTLSAVEQERLPDYAAWLASSDRLARFDSALRDIQSDGVLGRHPLRLLSGRLVDVDRPLERVANALGTASRHIERLVDELTPSSVPPELWNTPRRARELIAYAKNLRWLARTKQLDLCDPASERSRALASSVKRLGRCAAKVDEAARHTTAWREKLPQAELALAMAQARQFEASSFSWLKPAWWRLRSILTRRYDFASHVVRPSWSQVLAALDAEYTAVAEHDHCREEIVRQFRFEGDMQEQAESVAAVRERLSALPAWLRRVHTALLKSPQTERLIELTATAEPTAHELTECLASFLDDFDDLPFDRLTDELRSMETALGQLPDYLACLTELAAMPRAVAAALRELPLSVEQLEAAVADRSLGIVFRTDRPLERFNATVRARHVDKLATLHAAWLDANAAALCDTVRRRFLDRVRLSGQSVTLLGPAERELKKQYTQGRRELEHEFGKSMRYRSIRDLVGDETGLVVKDLKPVWLMSPLSVSDTLPLVGDLVDVVIFDEASQIPLEESLPSIFRGRQVIVVGDEMQLPPTDFFAAKRDGEDEEGTLTDDDTGELVPYDLDSNSFLNHAAKNLPSTMLGWHYRSRSESLISFSNWAFYDGRLLTVPDQRIPAPGRTAIEVDAAAEVDIGAAAAGHVGEVLDRSISFHFLQHGVYDNRRNRSEADYIAGLVRGLLRERTGLSIGVIAFSEAQQGEIEAALNRLAQDDAEFRELFEAELEREVDGQFVGLLVKNLENIQGDERDVVLMSVCYGPGPTGKMLMNFGPINRNGGEKRLNVAFSRAKRHMVLVSSIRQADIRNDYNDGANCLKNYLRYAEAVSLGQIEAARRVLDGVGRGRDEGRGIAAGSESSVADQIAAALSSRGLVIDRGVGQSHFRVDLAVRRADEHAYRLGVLVDGSGFYESADILERDLMRPQLLHAFGWQVIQVLTKDFVQSREAVIARLLAALE